MRLTPLDAAFLAVETPTAHMHVGWAAVFERPEGRRRPTFNQLREHIRVRLPRAPRYRQMIRSVPLGLDAPVWVDDPDFEIGRHVLHAEANRLTDVVDECMSEPLARDRPLWEIRVAPRLDDGRIGLVGKAHHCMVDGIAAVELASLLLDPDPDASPPAEDDWAPDAPPAAATLLAGGIAEAARRQFDLATLPARLVASPGKARELLERGGRAARALVDAARPAKPVRPFNQPISPRRHLGLLARPVEDLLRVKRAFEVKLNDIMLAVSAGGVRRFLKERDQAPVRLKTMVPVNVRAEEENAALGNRISFIFVDLPCEEPDPVRRLRRLYAATRDRKAAGEPEGASAVVRSIGLAPAPLRGVVSRLVASPRTFNLVVSNIPGPREPMYMRGCPLREAYPVVPIADQHSLSIGITTVGDGAFFGLYADRETLPDADSLARCIDEELDELLQIADKEPDREMLPAAAP